MKRHRHTLLAMVVLEVASGVFILNLPAALAHEGEEETSAKELVLQGIALLRGQPDQSEAIEDKMHDALEAEDASGVELSLVERADEAFEGGDLHEARDLLEEAVGAAPHRVVEDPGKGVRSPAPESEEETEAAAVLHEQEISGGLRGPEGTVDWTLVVLAGLLGIVGLALARRFR